MKKVIILLLFVAVSNLVIAQRNDNLIPDFGKPSEIKGMKLVWNDEFNNDGEPNPLFWKHEIGFVRNNELQWYQSQNASCKDGVLLIEGRREQFSNPNYKADSKDWRSNRQEVTFTSSSIQTRGLKEWQYGTFIIRAKIDTTLGAWPAIWTLGVNGQWPSNGEIDIMEFYRVKSNPTILANVAWGTEKQYVAKWDEAKISLSHFTEKNNNWVNEFHIWRMDWTSKSINLYLDDELLNSTSLSESINPDGKNPFTQPHYLLLNLAIGSNNGGQPNENTHKIRYEVDYVRVYQSK